MTSFQILKKNNLQGTRVLKFQKWGNIYYIMVQKNGNVIKLTL